MLTAVAASLLLSNLAGQAPPLAPDARMKWWREARFGMFIHWGAYSGAGGYWKEKPVNGVGEWLMTYAQIKPADYEPLGRSFNPQKYDPTAWVKLAKAAGMKYIVITSKHHDGYGLWPSAQTDWHSQKDLLKPLAEACKKEGIKLGFYHSIMDWTHPDYLPRRGWDDRPTTGADYDRYVKYMKAQLKELLTGYGNISILWFDGQWEGTWTDERGRDLEKYVRSLQPEIVINNRVSHSGNFGDCGTPEQFIPGKKPEGDWESCMTLNDTWGYKRDDHNWKSAETVITNLLNCASKGGNYLLNVGPTGDGEIPMPSQDILRTVGTWTKRNGEAIYGTQAGPWLRPLKGALVTQKGKVIYVAVTDKSASTLELTGLKTKIKTAREIGGRAIPFIGNTLAVGAPRNDIRVVKVELTELPVVEAPVTRADATGTISLVALDADSDHGITYEADKDALGLWTNAAGTVSWNFEASAGAVTPVISYACEDASAGATVTVDIGGQKQTLVIEGTGGWAKFVTKTLAPVALTAGKQTVTVKAVTKPGQGVMNLKSLKLVPVR